MDCVNSPEGLAEYLKSELRIPDRFCQAFIGTVTVVMLQLCQFLSLDNYIDGKEFRLLTREDISRFIEPVGIVKIVRHIEELKCVEVSKLAPCSNDHYH